MHTYTYAHKETLLLMNEIIQKRYKKVSFKESARNVLLPLFFKFLRPLPQRKREIQTKEMKGKSSHQENGGKLLPLQRNREIYLFIIIILYPLVFELSCTHQD